MGRFCVHCGKDLLPDAKFCPACGKPTEKKAVPETKQTPVPAAGAPSPEIKKELPPVRSVPEKMYRSCICCGGPVSEKAAFCRNCGAAQEGRRAGKARLPLRKVVMGVISCLLIVTLLASEYITPYFLRYVQNQVTGLFQKEEKAEPVERITGLSSISISKKDRKTEPEIVTVRADSPQVRLSNGVQADFQMAVLFSPEEELAVRDLGLKSDGQYEARVYDFELTCPDGDPKEVSSFYGAAELLLPYDPSWGRNVLVQYYNPDTKDWEFCYTETDGNGNAICYTTHFCTFAVFRDAVLHQGEGLEGDPSGPVFAPEGGGGHISPDTHAVLNYAALANQLRPKEIEIAGAEDSNKALIKAGVELVVEGGSDVAGYILDKALGKYTAEAVSMMGHAAFAAENIGKAAEKTIQVGQKYIQRIAIAGAVWTLGRVALDTMEAYRMSGGSAAVRQVMANWKDISGALTGVGATLLAGKTKTLLETASLSLSAWDILDDLSTVASQGFAGSLEERVYWDITRRCLYYTKDDGFRVVHNEVKYSEKGNLWSDLWEDHGLFERTWSRVVDAYIENPEEWDSVGMQTYMEERVEEYVDWFWDWSEDPANEKELNGYLHRMGVLGEGEYKTDIYHAPSALQKEEMKKHFKHEIVPRLKEIVRAAQIRRCLEELEFVYEEYTTQVAEWNQPVDIYIYDSSFGDFHLSPMGLKEPRAFRLANGWKKYSDQDWIFEDVGKKGYHLQCTQYAYMLVGAPKYLMIDGEDEKARQDIPDFHYSVYYDAGFENPRYPFAVYGPYDILKNDRVISMDLAQSNFFGEYIGFVRGDMKPIRGRDPGSDIALDMQYGLKKTPVRAVIRPPDRKDLTDLEGILDLEIDLFAGYELQVSRQSDEPQVTQRGGLQAHLEEKELPMKRKPWNKPGSFEMVMKGETVFGAGNDFSALHAVTEEENDPLANAFMNFIETAFSGVQKTTTSSYDVTFRIEVNKAGKTILIGQIRPRGFEWLASAPTRGIGAIEFVCVRTGPVS